MSMTADQDQDQDQERDQDQDQERCGFVAVLGAPNAGKSTLVNRLVGAKVSIVSPKPQTTRIRISGIAIDGRAQMILLDTPGIFAPRRRLDRAMVEAAWRTAGEADAILLLVDAERGLGGAAGGGPLVRGLGSGLGGAAEGIVEGLTQRRLRAVLALNKVDRVRPPVLLALADQLNRTGLFTDTFMISALTGDGVLDLRRFLVGKLPPGPWHYPEDQLSDLSERLLAAEATREQVLLQLREELPYAIAVETEEWEERGEGGVRIGQVLYVARESQRAIVIGARGARIKAIGQAARVELARLLGRPVHLFLHVKVAERWADQPSFYRLWGLDYGA
jgi:GTP-binding protein Era